MKRNKLKGFSILEVIIGVFLLSILSIGIVNSLLSIQNFYSNQQINKEMLNIAESSMELEISGTKVNSDDNGFKIEVTSNKEGLLNHIKIKVTHEESDNEIILESYY